MTSPSSRRLKVVLKKKLIQPEGATSPVVYYEPFEKTIYGKNEKVVIRSNALGVTVSKTSYQPPRKYRRKYRGRKK